jgi:hypothetical protein
MVDELPVFVLNLIRRDQNAARARIFLYWLRQMRQMPPPEGERLRFLLAGSIGLDTVASRYRIGDTVNDLAIKTLGTFSPETANRFLEALGKGYGLDLSPEVRSRICERAEWLIPYYLQLFFGGCLRFAATNAPCLLSQWSMRSSKFCSRMGVKATSITGISG